MNSLIKSLPACFALALAIVIGGCQQPDISPPPGAADPYPAPGNDPQVAVLSPELRPWLGFHSAVVVNDGERPMQVQVPVRNLTERKYLISYRYLFYDPTGMEVIPVMGWRRVALDPKQTLRLRGSALTSEAVDYKLEVKWANQ